MTAPVEEGVDVADEVAAVDKPMVYFDEKLDRYVYRASALMSCQNALLLARNGVTGHLPPKKMQERYDEGHAQEGLILGKLDADFGFLCYAHQQEVELTVGTGALIRGHIDALSTAESIYVDRLDMEPYEKELDRPDWVCVVDAKALAPSGFASWTSQGFEAFIYYLWQQATYLYAGDWDAVVMAVKDKVTGRVYVDLFTKAWIKKRLPKATLLQRVMWIESQAKKGILFDDVCSPTMYPCPYYDMHPAKENADKPDKPEADMDKAELRRLSERVVELDAKKKAIEADVETAKTDIANHIGNKAMAAQQLGTCSTSAYFSGGSSVMWKEITEALGEKGVDAVKKRFTRKTSSSKLTVKVTPIDVDAKSKSE